jgi:ankyrin repeat protein
MVMDEIKSTPLHLASSVGSAETVQLLIEHGAEVAAQDVNNRTPLHLASCRVSTKTMKLCDRHGLMLMDRTRGTKSVCVR